METNNKEFFRKIHPDMANGLHEKVANGNASASILREMTADGLRKQMQEMREDILEHVNNRINVTISEVLRNVETTPAENGELPYNADKYHDKKQSDKEGTLPNKEFLTRNSLLTDLFEIAHIRTIYNLFIVIFIFLFLDTAVNDIMGSGELFIGTVTLQKAFRNFPVCLHIWSFMQISTIGIYMAFNIWANQRSVFLPNYMSRKFWDYGWLAALIFYQVSFIIFPLKAMLQANLALCCNLIVLMEQARFVMKSYAFIRSVVPRYLAYKPHSELPLPKVPGFSQYLYFLFAPTLVYRDSYPRTDKIRWKVVAWNFFEVGLAIFHLSFIMERFVFSVFQDTQYLESKWFVKNILEAIIPGILFFMTGNYLLLHSWMNAWAEMLQFADRMFYKDWWNCTSYRTYYRTWNVVVHDWLYTYIYKDMYEILFPLNKTLATMAVFFVSAAYHEYILAFGFGFFYPVMLIMFGGLGCALLFLGKIASGNTFMWFSFFVGNGIMFNLYSMELYARVNCLPHPDFYIDFFLPRSWNCQQYLGA